MHEGHLRVVKCEGGAGTKDGFGSYEAPAPAMEMVSGEPHLAQNLVDLRQVSRDQPLLKCSIKFL